MNKDFSKSTNDELVRQASGSNAIKSGGAEDELKLRALKANLDAAEANRASAEYAKESVRWMFWSVVVLAAASVASLALDLLQYLYPSSR